MCGLTFLVLLWPAVHAILVARYEIDPWELFGWSMYARPAARVQILVEVARHEEVEAGKETAYRPLRAMGQTRDNIKKFARRRTALGELASTATLAKTLQDEDPTLSELRITTRSIQLDPKTAHLVAQDRQTLHPLPRKPRPEKP